MSRSSSHKSEAFCSRTVCKDGGVLGYCIESGDDLVLLLIGFGRGVWVCDDGRLSGPFFIVCSALQGYEEEIEERYQLVDMLSPSITRQIGWQAVAQVHQESKVDAQKLSLAAGKRN